MKTWKLLILLIMVAGLWLFRGDIRQWYQKFTLELPPLENFIRPTTNLVEKITQELRPEIIAPPPLRRSTKRPGTTLTRSGVITATNRERQKLGLPLLKENTKLNASAELKLKDMFAQQYFEHVSPSGVAVKDLTTQTNYRFIIIGENLALGNFDSDADIVTAWMNSPGHRANILNQRFTEIGVAVGQGIFEGHKTWIGVQHFGHPLASCPLVNETLLAEIKTQETNLTTEQITIEKLRAELETDKPKTEEEYEKYKMKVDQYNELVAHYNTAVGEFKTLVATYNTSIQKFNSCIQQN